VRRGGRRHRARLSSLVRRVEIRRTALPSVAHGSAIGRWRRPDVESPIRLPAFHQIRQCPGRKKDHCRDQQDLTHETIHFLSSPTKASHKKLAGDRHPPQARRKRASTPSRRVQASGYARRSTTALRDVARPGLETRRSRRLREVRREIHEVDRRRLRDPRPQSGRSRQESSGRAFAAPPARRARPARSPPRRREHPPSRSTLAKKTRESPAWLAESRRGRAPRSLMKPRRALRDSELVAPAISP